MPSYWRCPAAARDVVGLGRSSQMRKDATTPVGCKTGRHSAAGPPPGSQPLRPVAPWTGPRHWAARSSSGSTRWLGRRTDSLRPRCVLDQTAAIEVDFHRSGRRDRRICRQLSITPVVAVLVGGGIEVDRFGAISAPQRDPRQHRLAWGVPWGIFCARPFVVGHAGQCGWSAGPPGSPVKITNESDWSVYWRTFSKGDTAYVAGLRDGILGPLETKTFQPMDTEVQIEFKWSNLFGSFLRRANKQELYRDDHGFTITADYKFVVHEPPPAPVAPVPTLHPQRVEQSYYGTTFQFFDLLRAEQSEVEQQAEFSISEARTARQSSEESERNTVTWGVSVKLAASDPEGVSSGEISGSWQHEVETELRKRFEATASTVRSSRETTTFTALGGKLNVLQCHWSTDVAIGEARCGDEVYEYRAVQSVSPSIELATYSEAELDSMSSGLRDAWRARTGKSGAD